MLPKAAPAARSTAIRPSRSPRGRDGALRGSLCRHGSKHGGKSRGLTKVRGVAEPRQATAAHVPPSACRHSQGEQAQARPAVDGERVSMERERAPATDSNLARGRRRRRRRSRRRRRACPPRAKEESEE
eukprot:scaffold2099_cov401-Prasinococcus_capsulatus_cf.AAC.1